MRADTIAIFEDLMRSEGKNAIVYDCFTIAETSRLGHRRGIEEYYEVCIGYLKASLPSNTRDEFII